MVGQASALSYAFHADFSLVVEHGRALLSQSHDRSVAPGGLP